MTFALLTFLGSLLLVRANNVTESHHCQVLPAATPAIAEFLMLGNRYLYAQHRFGPPIFSEKCYSSTYFLSDYNIFDNSVHATWTYYDKSDGGPRKQRMVGSIIGNKSKYYAVHRGREVINTKIAVTPEYTVNYECSGDKHAVEIFTPRKHRDERVIQDAIRAARKIIDLPSPSVNLECDKLVREP